MEINKRPLKIIVQEQFGSAILLVLVLAIFIGFAPRILIIGLSLSVETSTYIYVGTLLVCLFGWFYVWLPYTCVRIWKSAKKYTQDYALYFFRAYSIVAFIVLVGSAVTAIPVIPEMINQLKLK